MSEKNQETDMLWSMIARCLALRKVNDNGALVNRTRKQTFQMPDLRLSENGFVSTKDMVAKFTSALKTLKGRAGYFNREERARNKLHKYLWIDRPFNDRHSVNPLASCYSLFKCWRLQRHSLR
jgi:hypothetical protein